MTRLNGEKTLTAVRITGTYGDVEMSCSGLFSLIGADPSADWLSGCALLDQGFVVTDLSLHDRDQGDTWRAPRRAPLPSETSRPGLFAVGDLRPGSTRRVAAAVGEGSAAVRSVHQYLTFGH